MADIFISYAREDQAWAEALARGLTDLGWSVWWDRNLPADVDFYSTTEEELDAARCVIVLWSAESRKSRWVLGEATEGLDCNKLIPVRIENVRQPLPFRGIHAASMVGWNQSLEAPAFLKVVSAVATLLGPPNGKAEKVAVKPPVQKKRVVQKKTPPAVYTDAWGIEYVLIQPGVFMMGSEANSDDEKPVHRVELTKRFYMGKYPVTQGEYEKVMGKNPSRFKKGSRYPVEQVSWQDAQEFINKVNAKESGSRLPTEAEWEYACRAGSSTAYSFGDNEKDLSRYGWYSSKSTHPVGEKEPNGWGLYDMHGNVWEWVADWYGVYSKDDEVDPVGAETGSHRVIRGGSWNFSARDLRSSYRRYDDPEGRDRDLGFRLVRNMAL